jgi:AmmeMemoRadiSam system protein B
MRKILLLLTLCSFFAGCGTPACKSEHFEDRQAEPPIPARLLSCDFHDRGDFDIYTVQAEIYEVDGKIISGVIPHHLLAGQMIASFFKTAAENRQLEPVETIIIIAPMHYDDTNTVLCTTLSDWAAPFGITRTEQGFSECFISNLGAEICDYNMQKDHSAAALIPFVKHYFPEAAVACLLIEANAPFDLPERLAPLLAEFAEEKNCLFLFSVDFSHYLKPSQTAQKDEESRAAIFENDTGRIAFMTNAHMDSPKSIITFLKLNELLSLQLRELGHSNSLKVSGIPYPHPAYDEGLTSYFVFAGIL